MFKSIDSLVPIVAIILVLSILGGCKFDNDGSGSNVAGTKVSVGGVITPEGQLVKDGEKTSFTVIENDGFFLEDISGCGGTLDGDAYNTGAISEDCLITANFLKKNYDVTLIVNILGVSQEIKLVVNFNEAATIPIDPVVGFEIISAQGCDGDIVGDAFVTGAIKSDCTVTIDFSKLVTQFGDFDLNFIKDKTYRFTWADVPIATHYKIFEDIDGISGYNQIGTDIPVNIGLYDHTVPLFARDKAKYILQGCNQLGCLDIFNTSVATSISATNKFNTAIGYVKAVNNNAGDQFGWSVALSGDGNVLAVGVPYESSNAQGINGNQLNNLASKSGAVYIYKRSNSSLLTRRWSLHAYIKASNVGVDDSFGSAIALSQDGKTLAVGAYAENSNASGINGDQTNNIFGGAGAVYVFVNNNNNWQQQTYIKASNPDREDWFGYSLDLSADGNSLAVGAFREQSQVAGINSYQGDNSASKAGAAYVFVRNSGSWSQQAYIKASNTNANDQFGWSISLSGDASTLAVGARYEDSNAEGINQHQFNNNSQNSGAVYLYSRANTTWTRQAYIKASNTGANDRFGTSVVLDFTGDTLAVGALLEDGNATSINGDQINGIATDSGAVYTFKRNMTTWSQQAYVKASNTTVGAVFSGDIDLSADGKILIAGAAQESGSSAGVNGNHTNLNSLKAGAAYVYQLKNTQWQFLSYLKASNPDAQDNFGGAVVISADGKMVAVGATNEDSDANNIDLINQGNSNNAINSGAVYIY